MNRCGFCLPFAVDPFKIERYLAFPPRLLNLDSWGSHRFWAVFCHWSPSPMTDFMTPIELIRNFLQERTDVDPAFVQPDALLADLSVDSFSLLELIFEFEERWNVSIPNDAVTPKTVQDIIDLVDKFMPESGNSAP